jgi:hypothetical protein
MTSDMMAPQMAHCSAVIHQGLLDMLHHFSEGRRTHATLRGITKFATGAVSFSLLLDAAGTIGFIANT